VSQTFTPKIGLIGKRANFASRVRVAAIKQNGRFPCPNCLTPKKELKNMGTQEDIMFRIRHPRMDNEATQNMIAAALAEVQTGYAVTGNVVNEHLKSMSLHPTRVSTTT
jgi:hypothetical protein